MLKILLYIYGQVRIDNICIYRKLQLQFKSPGPRSFVEMMVPLSLEVPVWTDNPPMIIPIL